MQADSLLSESTGKLYYKQSSYEHSHVINLWWTRALGSLAGQLLRFRVSVCLALIDTAGTVF